MNSTPRFRLMCNLLALILVLAALSRIVPTIAMIGDPLAAAPALRCTPGCRVETDPVLLLHASVWKQAWRTPGIEEKISRRLGEPGVKPLLFAAKAARAIPLFLFFVALALAMRSFARAGYTIRAVRWLRRAAIAAIVWTLAEPLAHALQVRALHAVLTGREQLSILFDLGDLLLGLTVAGAAWVSVWTIEKAIRLQADLEEYV